jgi:hypothetical protein
MQALVSLHRFLTIRRFVLRFVCRFFFQHSVSSPFAQTLEDTDMEGLDSPTTVSSIHLHLPAGLDVLPYPYAPRQRPKGLSNSQRMNQK